MRDGGWESGGRDTDIKRTMTRKYKNIAKRCITFYSFFRKLNQKKKNSTPSSSESLLAH